MKKSEQCNIRGIVYVYRNYSNTEDFGKAYVGCTIDEATRRSQWNNSEIPYAGMKINVAREKYKDFMDYIVPEEYYGSDSKELIAFLEEREIFYIQVYDSFKNGYNSNLGGRGNLGVKLSKATRRKMSKKKKGHLVDIATKKKISDSMKRYYKNRKEAA